VLTIVLLTENALTDHDVQRVAHLHDPEPVRIHVVIPVHEDADAEATAASQQELATSLRLLTAAGVTEVDGELSSAHPVDAVAHRAGEIDADEVIVLTEPHLIADWTRRDWATRLRRTLDLPLLHVVSGTDQVVS
jgi:hypothetical protein